MGTSIKINAGYTLLFVLLFMYFQSNITFAAPSIPDAKLKEVIEEAVNKQYESSTIPMGVIYINAPIHGNSGVNPNKRIFGNSLMKYMEALKKLGFINMQKEQFIDFNYLKYNVSITNNGEKQTAKKLDNGDYLLKSYGKAKVNKIVKNTEYKLETAPNDEYRLILGVLDFYPSDLGKKLELAIEGRCDNQYKFKVLLKYDPFNNKYKYVMRDWGYLDKDGWESNRIP